VKARLLALSALALLAAPAVRAAPEAVDADRGEALVRLHCSGCHAAGREDRSPMAAAPPLRELHRRYEPELLGEALAEGILTGHPAMPAFSFAPPDVEAIIRYLDSIQTRQKG
jgi:cytochrome c